MPSLPIFDRWLGELLLHVLWDDYLIQPIPQHDIERIEF